MSVALLVCNAHRSRFAQRQLTSAATLEGGLVPEPNGRRSVSHRAAGMALELVLATGVTRFLAAFLSGISPTDLWVFAGVILLLALVAFTAALVPALRASRLDPIAALRNN